MKFLLFFSLIFMGCFGLNACSSVNEKKESNIDATMEKILELASLAPSSHNAQMWKVKIISSRELIVSVDQTKNLPFSDKEGFEALISIGAFLENMVEATKNENLESNITFEEKENILDTEIKVVFTPKDFGYDFQREKNIIERHSIKGVYSVEDIKEEHLKNMLFSDKIHYFDVDSAGGSFIKNSIHEASFAEAYDKDIQKELSNWIMTSGKEEKIRKEGIRPEQMDIFGLKKFFFYTFFTKKSIQSEKFVKIGLEKTEEQLNNCAGFFIIQSKSNSSEDIVNMGRTLEKLLLTATENRIAVQIMSQTNHKEPWRSNIKDRFDFDGQLLIIRAGYVKDYGKAQGLRREVSSFISH